MHFHPLPFAAALIALIYQVDTANAGSDSAHRDFLELCADCHNADAKGNGPLAKNLTKIPPDLTRIRERAHGVFDEKAVYDWILGLKMTESHGSREMPIWGDWLMDEAVEDSTSLDTAKAAEREVEQRIMAIVKYLEGLQTKGP
ncbi:c-type cytochrome [Taklimakanibacter deserti]|uniref:c-type cytochrome n=1 Tax=Taklimakanibacter deserti TaxID=2267839 RepID=UPI000E64FD60